MAETIDTNGTFAHEYHDNTGPYHVPSVDVGFRLRAFFSVMVRTFGGRIEEAACTRGGGVPAAVPGVADGSVRPGNVTVPTSEGRLVASSPAAAPTPEKALPPPDAGEDMPAGTYPVIFIATCRLRNEKRNNGGDVRD